MAEVAADSGYPSLQSVPPRPQLSYTVQQQRQIVEALIADRENARYTGQVVRHRTGLSSLPPPPPEPATSMTIEPAIAAREGGGPEPRLVEQETLADFIGALFFDEPAHEPDDPDRSSEPAVRDEPPDDVDRQEPPAPTAGSTGSPGAASGQAPVPPSPGAVAARHAAGPEVIDTLFETVPQTPLPPRQSALAARLAIAEQVDVRAAAAPLPAARPTMARAVEAALPTSLPAPPPLKPIVPVDASTPPRPVEKPADHRSAAARQSWIVANAAP